MASAQLILLGTGCSGGTPNWIYPEVAEGQVERGHPCALYVAADGKAYLIDAPGTIRGQLISAKDILISEYEIENILGYKGRVTPLKKPKHLNIEGVIFTHADDDHINGLTYLRDLVVINECNLPIFAPEDTLEYLTAHFSFPFRGAMTIVKGGDTEPTVLRYDGTPFNHSGPTQINDGLYLDHTMVRHGNPTKLAAALALPGIVYAPDISHAEDNLFDLVERTAPQTVVLNLQREARPMENYAHLGIEEFLIACKRISEVSPTTTQIVTTHMSTLIPLDSDLQELLDLHRGDFGIPNGLQITVGQDGMRLPLHNLPELKPGPADDLKHTLG